MKNKKIITTFILVILLNGAVLAGWFYLLSVIDGKFNEINEIRSKIIINDAKIQEGSSLKKSIAEVAEEKQKVDSIFLDKQSVIKLIKELESIANKTGASIDIGSINMFSLKGRFSQLFHCLVLLENIPYAISIDKMDFQKQEKDMWQANFEISLNSFINI
jgi:tetrahydromethanopterin S-methyltransferase subunit B